MLIDSHCHIHDENFPLKINEVFENARNSGISKIICIGTDLKNSQRAIEFAEEFSGEKSGRLQIFACVGVHPHEAKDFFQNGSEDFEKNLLKLEKLIKKSSKVVGIGEIGLDYFYQHSPKKVQIKVLKAQLKLALKHNLPISFHVRNAFDDFWEVFNTLENSDKIRGVLHSFTDNQENLQRGLSKNLFFGVNGISTFVKTNQELETFAKIPLKKILLETDAPYLAPKGKRGEKNQPAFVNLIAKDLAQKRELSLEEIAEITSKNAQKLFKF